MSQYTLLTGGTGLVGRYLLRDLLRQGHRLAVVLRPARKRSIRQRIESILQMWEAEDGVRLPRPVCLEGDVTRDHLGLSSDQRQWIAANCNRMIHSAAILAFHTDSCGEPWKTNVQGTQNALQLCRVAEIRDLHYVSTAYVCGEREGLVREDELDVGQSFRNDYERSKFDAEKLVRSAEFLDRLTIYRPAVISGDSRTGYTSTYHGLYLYLRLMAMLVPSVEPDSDGVRHTRIRLPMTGNEPRNIVPVDWVSAVICRLLNTPPAHGGVYHLSPVAPITPRQIIEYAYRYFNSTGVEYVGDRSVSGDEGNSFESSYLANISTYESYNATDPTFDRSNLERFAGDLVCPVIDEEVLHRYIAFGERDRWGKRREAAVGASYWLEDQLRLAFPRGAVPRDENGDGRRVIGLDLLGPGGGQWRMLLEDDGVAAFEAGLPSKSCFVLRLTAEEFLQRAVDFCSPVLRRGAADRTREERCGVHLRHDKDPAFLGSHILSRFARSYAKAAGQ